MKNNDKEKIVKALEDIEMCLKRITDFLSTDGYVAVRNYIDRLDYDLEDLKGENHEQ